MPNEIDREEARKDLERSLQYSEKKALGFVHYECGEIGKDRHVHAIAVKVRGVVESQLFSVGQGEVESLKGFAEYMDARSSDRHLWCMWGMRNESYGFRHLDARLRELANDDKVLIPTPNKVLDLSNTCWQLYGDIRTGGRNRLPFLCELNGISTQGAIDFCAIQDAVKGGRWSAVEASVLRKVEMIYALWDRMVAGELTVYSAETPRKRRPRGRPKAPESDLKLRTRLYDAWQTGRHGSRKDLAKEFGISLRDAERLLNSEGRARSRKRDKAKAK